jgi:hypothetical protein
MKGGGMSQIAQENVYRKLGDKIDNLTVKAPWNETFHSILKELYTPEEADVVVRMRTRSLRWTG